MAKVQSSFRGFYPLDRKFLKEEVLGKTVVFNAVPIIPKEVDTFVKPNRLLVNKFLLFEYNPPIVKFNTEAILSKL